LIKKARVKKARVTMAEPVVLMAGGGIAGLAMALTLNRIG
jgi:heterodisulfide reductase subunit A-like polyferredoxin